MTLQNNSPYHVFNYIHGFERPVCSQFRSIFNRNPSFYELFDMERYLERQYYSVNLESAAAERYGKLETSFCECFKDPANHGIGKRLPCSCGEEFDVHEWGWNVNNMTSATRFSEDGREVQFHPVYSSGTVGIRGDMPFVQGNHYYWEIKILSPLYGTDVMIGVGTAKVNLSRYTHEFCSMLGEDEESWGYSYKGIIQHKGMKRIFGSSYGHGSIVGVHLDMWSGTIEFFLNRKPLGLAFSRLCGQTVYPMVCSTAAKSFMRVTYSTSTPSTLQLLCLKTIYTKPKLVERLRTVPLLRSLVDIKYWWMFQSKPEDKDKDETDDDIFNDSSEFDTNLFMCMNMIADESKSKSASDEDKENKIAVKKRRIGRHAEPPTSASGSNLDKLRFNCYCRKRKIGVNGEPPTSASGSNSDEERSSSCCRKRRIGRHAKPPSASESNWDEECTSSYPIKRRIGVNAEPPTSASDSNSDEECTSSYRMKL